MSQDTNWENDLDMMELSVRPTIGKNEFGRPLWIFPIDRSKDGRILCPYCGYAGHRISQTKNHFLTQHFHLEILPFTPSREDRAFYEASALERKIASPTPAEHRCSQICPDCNVVRRQPSTVGLTTAQLRARQHLRESSSQTSSHRTFAEVAKASETLCICKQTHTLPGCSHDGRDKITRTVKTEPMECESVQEKSSNKKLPPPDDYWTDPDDEEFEELVKELEKPTSKTKKKTEVSKPVKKEPARGIVENGDLIDVSVSDEEVTARLNKGKSAVQLPKCCHDHKKSL
jgi:hypothetical protein